MGKNKKKSQQNQTKPKSVESPVHHHHHNQKHEQEQEQEQQQQQPVSGRNSPILNEIEAHLAAGQQIFIATPLSASGGGGGGGGARRGSTAVPPLEGSPQSSGCVVTAGTTNTKTASSSPSSSSGSSSSPFIVRNAATSPDLHSLIPHTGSDDSLHNFQNQQHQQNQQMSQSTTTHQTFVLTPLQQNRSFSFMTQQQQQEYQYGGSEPRENNSRIDQFYSNNLSHNKKQKPQTPTSVSHPRQQRHPDNKFSTFFSSSSSSKKSPSPENSSSSSTTTRGERERERENKVEGSFVPIFSLSNQDDHPVGSEYNTIFSKLSRLLGGLVLISRIKWSHLLIWLASYFYVPMICLVAITTANVMLGICATAILPVIEYNVSEAERAAVAAAMSSSSSEFPSSPSAVFNYSSSMFRRVAGGAFFLSSSASDSSSSSSCSSSPLVPTTSLAAVGAATSLAVLVIFGAAISGYKISSLIGDAFLDSCRVVTDKRHDNWTLLLYSLFCDIVKIFSLGRNYVAIFIIMIIFLPTLVLSLVRAGDFGIERRPAFVVAFFSCSLEVAWLIFQIARFLIRISKDALLLKKAKQSIEDQEKELAQIASPVEVTEKGKSSFATAAASGGAAVSAASTSSSRTATPSPSSPTTTTTTTLTGRVPAPPQENELTRQLARWWSRKIPKMRRRGFALLFLTSIFILLGSGLTNCLIALVEGFLYVSFVHLFAHFAARTTLFVHAVHDALHTIFNDTVAAISALIIFPILLAAALTNYFRFGLFVGLLQVPVLILAVCSISSHANDLREKRINERNKRRQQRKQQQQRRQDPEDSQDDEEKREENSILSSVLLVLWKVALFNPRRSFAYGAHYRYAQYLRVALRALLAVFTVGIVFVSVQVTIQSVNYKFEQFKSELVRVESNETTTIAYTNSFTLVMGTHDDDDDNNNNNGNNAQDKDKKHKMQKGKQKVENADDEEEEEEEDDDDQRRHRHQQQEEEQERKLTKSQHRYQGVCQRRWFTDGENENSLRSLSFSDLTFFAMLAYVAPHDEENSFRQLFDFYKKQRSGGEYWEQQDPNEIWHQLEKKSFPSDPVKEQERKEVLSWSQIHLPQSLHPPFFHLKRDKSKFSPDDEKEEEERRRQGIDNLFVMPGTEPKRASDIFQNVILFAPSFLLEFSANLLPGIGLLPVEFLRDLIAVTNSLYKVPAPLYYHEVMKRYMRAVQMLGEEENDSYLAVGHSLAGTSLGLSATPLRIPVVALSSPGTFFMSRQFNVPLDLTEAYTTNMVISQDLIPLIGSTNGEVHNVVCEYTAPLICHSVQLSFYRTMQLCPDIRKNAFKKMKHISYRITPSPMVEYLQGWNKMFEKLLGFKLEFEKAL